MYKYHYMVKKVKLLLSKQSFILSCYNEINTCKINKQYNTMVKHIYVINNI